MNAEEQLKFIKILKIKKYIEIILKNCSDRIDQKDSLYYLRNEISPLINSNEPDDEILLNHLTLILFITKVNKVPKTNPIMTSKMENTVLFILTSIYFSISNRKIYLIQLYCKIKRRKSQPMKTLTYKI